MKNTNSRKTRKNHKTMKGAGFFDYFKSTFSIKGDYKFCILNVPNGSDVKCALCAGNIFLRRPGTIGKSITGDIASEFILGDSKDLLDTSIICYFCNNCGNAIVVRDELQPGLVYKNVVKPTFTDKDGKPLPDKDGKLPQTPPQTPQENK